MENSEVLDAQEVNTPREDTQETQDNSVNDTVINSMYQEAQRPTKVTGIVGENNYAPSLAQNALSQEEANKTYNYTSQEQKQYDESYTSTTVKSNGEDPLEHKWEPTISLDKGFKMEDDADFSWNIQARKQADLEYYQQLYQNRYESMLNMQEFNTNARKAWKEYYGAELAAAQTQEKMGWTGGQEQASDLQVKFLQAETASNMYTQLEAQRYGVETKLSVARMYADAEQNKLALDYYQDARDRAMKEGEMKGWYIPVECEEMMAQDEIANKVLEDPNSTDEEKARARDVLKATHEYYDSRGFERGYAYDENGNVVTEYYAIKLLSQKNYELQKEWNKIQEDLQREANQIAQQNADTALGELELRRKEYNLSVIQQDLIESESWSKGITNGTVVRGTTSGGYYEISTMDPKTGDVETTRYPISEGTEIYRNSEGDYAVKISRNGTSYYMPVQGVESFKKIEKAQPTSIVTEVTNKLKEVGNKIKEKGAEVLDSLLDKAIPTTVTTQYYNGAVPEQTRNDIKTYGAFESTKDNNGYVYQPKGITGHGKLSKTGEMKTLKTTDLKGNTKIVAQNVWKAEDGTKWMWNGTTLQYDEI